MSSCQRPIWIDPSAADLVAQGPGPTVLYKCRKIRQKDWAPTRPAQTQHMFLVVFCPVQSRSGPTRTSNMTDV